MSDPFEGLTFAVLTISDSVANQEKDDVSGPLTSKLVQSLGGTVTGSEAVADERPQIAEVTVRTKGPVLRVRESAEDMYAAIDQAARYSRRHSSTPWKAAA